MSSPSETSPKPAGGAPAPHDLTGEAAPVRPPWWQRLDLLAPAVPLVALAVYASHGFGSELNRDAGLYAHGGQLAADGTLPYAGIANRAGPLAQGVPGVAVALARLVDVDEVLAIRLLYTVLAAAAVGLVYLAGRRLFDSRIVGLAGAATVLCFEVLIRTTTSGPHSKNLMMVFLAAALAALVHRRWMTTGVFTALATLTWQPVFFGLIATAGLTIFTAVEAGKLRALVRLAVGGLVPTVLVVAVYAMAGELRTFVDGFFLINWVYTDPVSWLDDPAYARERLDINLGWTLWVGILGLVVSVAAALVALARTRGHHASNREAALMGLGLFGVIELLWTLKAYDGSPDTFVLVPGAALGVATVAALLPRVLPARGALTLVLVWTLVGTGSSLAHAVDTRNDLIDDQRAQIETVLEVLPDDATMASLGAPEVMVLADQQARARFQTFSHGMSDYIDESFPGGMTGYVRSVVDQAPTLVVVGTFGVPSALDDPLAPEYVPVGEAGSWVWYARQDVGSATLDELRGALRN